ncbi:MAG: hypoxanthine phosphoribosyltransferase [Gemmatimonadetes bacterium]|nr:hypoxanthine phosphoribosyltransferase [Gemmatimonadota bacterium]
MSTDLDAPIRDAKICRVVYSTEQIAARVAEMGREITRHYEGREDLLVIGLLKGSFIFVADLVRTIHFPHHVDFLIASSYGTGMDSSGIVEFLYDPGVRIQGRHVILVEDIVDTGSTIDLVLPLLEKRGPESLELCVLLHKRRVRLKKEPRWVGFDAPQEFLVGYGLDHAESFRHLPFIGSL